MNRLIADLTHRTSLLLLCCACTLALCAAVGSRMLDHDLQARPRLARIRDINLGIGALSDDLLACESSQRGYLLTANVRYLLPFGDRSDQVEVDVRSLQALTASDSEAAADFAPVVPLVTQKMSELRRTVSLATSGHRTQALAVVETDQGIDTMTAIHSRLGGMAAQQRHKLDETFERNLENARDTRTWIIDDVAFAWLLVMGALVSLCFDLRAKV